MPYGICLISIFVPISIFWAIKALGQSFKLEANCLWRGCTTSGTKRPEKHLVENPATWYFTAAFPIILSFLSVDCLIYWLSTVIRVQHLTRVHCGMALQKLIGSEVKGTTTKTEDFTRLDQSVYRRPSGRPLPRLPVAGHRPLHVHRRGIVVSWSWVEEILLAFTSAQRS